MPDNEEINITEGTSPPSNNPFGMVSNPWDWDNIPTPASWTTNIVNAVDPIQSPQSVPVQQVSNGIIDQIIASTGYTPNAAMFDYISNYSNITGKKVTTKKIKYIETDEETKDMAIAGDVQLTRDEINLAIVDNPLQLFLSKQVANSDGLYDYYPIGKFFHSRVSADRKAEDKIYLILSHAFDGKIYETNRESYTAYRTTANRQSLKYILLDIATNKIVVKDKFSVENYLGSLGNTSSITSIARLKYKIKSSTLSGKVFGFATIKSKLVDTVIDNIILDRGDSRKLGTATWYANVRIDDRNFKFCLADLELVLPTLKGYNFPKDKTIIKNDLVILKTDNSQNQYRVMACYAPNLSSKRLSKNSQTRQLDVLQLANIVTGESKKVYAKNVKLINNKDGRRK